MRPVLVACMVMAVSLSGCTAFNDFVDQLNRPNISVSRTDVTDTNEFGYVTISQFSVAVLDPGGAYVVITALEAGGLVRTAEGLATAQNHVSVELTDGSWTISYTVDGHDWETFKNVLIDATPPDVSLIEAFGTAQNGEYTIGATQPVEPGASVTVRDAQGRILASSLPHTVTGLGSGIHFFLVEITDGAGNQATRNIQVAAGDAKLLPEGEHTFGIVARYTNTARIWDISDMGIYLRPDEARAATGGKYLGSGFGITPDDPAVQDIVAQEVHSSDTTMEASFKLFRWLMDNLEYTEERLEANDLLEPRETIENGGGVCRDLAAMYVSLLRAAGIPARLVSGYLAGNVNGFHAWVEVYVGARDGRSAWMPVDVSPIDGTWDEKTNSGIARGVQIAIQSFGIQLPEYLGLRKISEAGEIEGWSTALSSSYTHNRGSPAPEQSFAKDLRDEGTPQHGVLCFDPDTLLRKLIMREDASSCTGMYVIGRDPNSDTFRNANRFVVGTQRIIDYGIQVDSASPGTTINFELSYPFVDDVRPDIVDYVPYSNIPDGYSFTQHEPDPVTGVIEGVLRR